jgi:hypothetical protein
MDAEEKLLRNGYTFVTYLIFICAFNGDFFLCSISYFCSLRGCFLEWILS